MTTWKKELANALALNNETWADVESITLTEAELLRVFDERYGGVEGSPFTAWTKNKVYFPVCYDGSEWVGWVSRNPDGVPTSHHGGG